MLYVSAIGTEQPIGREITGATGKIPQQNLFRRFIPHTTVSALYSNCTYTPIQLLDGEHAFLLTSLHIRVSVLPVAVLIIHADASKFVFSHSWSHVVIGMWHKYPNPHCTHVQTIDVLDRTVDPETGIIRTERVLGCKQKTPTWIVKVCPMISYRPLALNGSVHPALRRLRGCICPRNIIHRPGDPRRHHHIR